MKFFVFIITLFLSSNLLAKGINVYSIGVFDIKFDGSDDKSTTDFRYEKRFDKTIFDIGPKEDNFFFLKPFIGVEYTGDDAYYFLSGIYVEDELGQLFSGENEKKLYFSPSFGIGYYNDGSGKNLGNDIQFRTTLEFNYQLKNNNRIGISIGHISNANLGDKNPGAEILSLNYQVPY